MKLSPYLTFNGKCEEAFRFYEQCLRGKIVTMMTHAETPMAEQIPSDRRGEITHVRLELGDNVLMGSDSCPGHEEEPQGFSVSLQLDKPAEAERIFSELAEGGAIRMPIQETFWAFRFGMLIDRFGTPWMVNCEKAA